MRDILFALAILSFLGGATSAQDLLVNGSFDEPAGASCQQQVYADTEKTATYNEHLSLFRRI